MVFTQCNVFAKSAYKLFTVERGENILTSKQLHTSPNSPYFGHLSSQWNSGLIFHINNWLSFLKHQTIFNIWYEVIYGFNYRERERPIIKAWNEHISFLLSKIQTDKQILLSARSNRLTEWSQCSWDAWQTSERDACTGLLEWLWVWTVGLTDRCSGLSLFCCCTMGSSETSGDPSDLLSPASMSYNGNQLLLSLNNRMDLNK